MTYTCAAVDCVAENEAELTAGWRMVFEELVQTERRYVDGIRDIIRGYYDCLPGCVAHDPHSNLPFTLEERDVLFGNLLEVVEFSSALVSQFLKADYQPKQIALCFLNNSEKFKVYATYCTQYGQAMDMFDTLSQRHCSSCYFRQCQHALGHSLPLDSYLLKPVQRILKYPLLLNSLVKQYGGLKCQLEGVAQLLVDAHECMSTVAQYINAAKQLREDVKTTEDIVGSIMGWVNPGKTGLFLAQDDVQVQHKKREPHCIYAFDNLLVITKPMKDCPELYRRRFDYSEVQLADVASEPSHFELHCCKEQVEADRHSQTIFPLLVCPRTVEKKALWMRILRMKEVDDSTVDVRLAREAGLQSPLVCKIHKSSDKRQSAFKDVLVQVRKAAGMQAPFRTQVSKVPGSNRSKSFASVSDSKKPRTNSSPAFRKQSSDTIIVFTFPQLITEVPEAAIVERS